MKSTCKLVLATLACVLCTCTVLASPLRGERNVDQLSPEMAPHLVGGNFTELAHSQYTVDLSLYKDNYLFRNCGAARLNSNWFITAAECLDSKFALLIVTIPTGDNFQYTRSFNDMRNLYYKIHPEYNEKTKANNIAVFQHKKLYGKPQQFLNLSRKSQQSQSFVNEPVVVSAWNHSNRTITYEELGVNILRTKVEDIEKCTTMYPQGVIKPYHICASSSGNAALSEEDVGVPLVADTTDGPVLIGIGSSIKPTKGSSSLPMVFTRTAPYLEWIRQETQIDLLD